MNKLQQFIASKPGGYLKDTDILTLVALDRLCPVLVRCGGCRFTCAAQDVAHLEACITAGGDYIRDVSFPVGSLEKAANWVQEPSFEKCRYNAENTKSNGLLGVVANKSKATAPAGYAFDESQCGGVFDGNQVTSDADPGL